MPVARLIDDAGLAVNEGDGNVFNDATSQSDGDKAMSINCSYQKVSVSTTYPEGGARHKTQNNNTVASSLVFPELPVSVKLLQVSARGCCMNRNFISIVNSVIDVTSLRVWTTLNKKGDTSSQLLFTMETFSSRFSPETSDFGVSLDNIDFRATRVDFLPPHTDYALDFDYADCNISAKVSIPKDAMRKLSNQTNLVTFASTTLGSILPTSYKGDSDNSVKYVASDLVIATTASPSDVNNLQLSFQGPNYSVQTPLCVFWDFALNGNHGAWNDYGCYPQILGSDVVCTCEHLTSFSILMSIKNVDSRSLDYLTFVGLGVSMASIVLCLSTEKIVWKWVTKNKTSFMRHLSIVNLAITLLIADMFFIASSVTKPQTKTCTAVVFIIHFFYLAMFFWMLVLGLIIFYRLVFIYHDMKLHIMKKIVFTIGYGFPTAIAVFTIVSTYPKNTYTRKSSCWLNWDESKALLAFIAPVLLIVTFNLIIVLVVLSKLLRPSVGDKPQHTERNTLVQVAKSIAILTPFLGLTWGFGIAMVVGNNSYGVNMIFTLLNAFQGLFIYVFGILLDHSVYDILKKMVSLSKSSPEESKTRISLKERKSETEQCKKLCCVEDISS
ncbi:adhesion G protein-coupled receptor F5-like [Protopterus annectens]|uniref:adhesion G protein-coupled receptor F5-like n=1 Tax=Protopterus annectens TaxID=7888 RepID=UPI001CFBB228|nr:adhesion G protein-coupled receptor F5-like [Protopterus annectens]